MESCTLDLKCFHPGGTNNTSTPSPLARTSGIFLVTEDTEKCSLCLSGKRGKMGNKDSHNGMPYRGKKRQHISCEPLRRCFLTASSCQHHVSDLHHPGFYKHTLRCSHNDKISNNYFFFWQIKFNIQIQNVKQNDSWHLQEIIKYCTFFLQKTSVNKNTYLVEPTSTIKANSPTQKQ
jgi:hypothetical protein